MAALRARLYRLIRRRRGEVAAELSPHWRGIAAPHRPLTDYVPLWVIGLAAAVILLFVFIGFRVALATGSDALYASLASLPKVAKPQIEGWTRPLPPPPPPPPQVAPTLAQERHFGVHRGPGERADGDRQAALRRSFRARQRRSRRALPADHRPHRRGAEEVAGVADGNRPYRQSADPQSALPVEFRAVAWRAPRPCATASGRSSRAADRIRVDGRGDKEPVADNHTPEGREMNRRIELVLLRSAAPQ